MSYVPLTDVWARNGLAAVVFGSLVDAGFHPLTECDLHGWMHYYKWPLGSERPLTIWVPESERDEAAAFLAMTPSETSPVADHGSEGFWQVVRASVPATVVGWLILMIFTGV